MDDNDEDEIYADDGFDSLPQDELLLLEQNAIRATQEQQELTDGSGYLKILPQAFSRQPQTTVKTPPNQILKKGPLAITRAPVRQQSSSDHGDFDPNDIDAALLGSVDEPVPVEEKDEVETLRFPSKATQREQWRQQPYARPNTDGQNALEFANPRRAGARLSQSQNLTRDCDDIGEIQMQDAPPENEPVGPPPNDEAETLRAQIQEVFTPFTPLEYALINHSFFARENPFGVILQLQIQMCLLSRARLPSFELINPRPRRTTTVKLPRCNVQWQKRQQNKSRSLIGSCLRPKEWRRRTNF
jgi:hypothetical protein